MNSIAPKLAASALMLAMMIHPQVSAADGFDGDTFLSWPEASQNSYVSTSVAMATFVATRTNQETATCLDTWYADSKEVAGMRNTYIRQKIKLNAEYHPSAVILLVLEEACGSFSKR